MGLFTSKTVNRASILLLKVAVVRCDPIMYTPFLSIVKKWFGSVRTRASADMTRMQCVQKMSGPIPRQITFARCFERHAVNYWRARILVCLLMNRALNNGGRLAISAGELFTLLTKIKMDAC